MADLRDVLRSFALQKMQELKDEGKEKDKRSRHESSSSSSKKKKKDRKRKDDSSPSEHKSKRQALSESSKHDKHHHHHRSHREKSESKEKDTGNHETKLKSDKDVSATSLEKDASKVKSDKGSEKLPKDTSSKSKTDVDLVKNVSEKNAKSDKDIHVKSVASKEKQDSNVESQGKASSSKVRIIRKSFSSKDDVRSDLLIPKESDKKEYTKSSKDVVERDKKKQTNTTKDSNDDIIEIKQIKKAKVTRALSKDDDDIIEIKTVDVKKGETKKMKKDADDAKKTIVETKKTKDLVDIDIDKKKIENLKKASSEQAGKSESNPKPISKPTVSTTSNISMTTVKSGPKTEKKIIRINIITKDLKVPTPPPSPPPKKPKKELEDGELSESQSDIESDSESDIDSESEESEKEEVTTADGRKVPWREQGSSEGEASSSTDSEKDGKTAADGTKKADTHKEGHKAKKHKHKHKKHKHKKDKEIEKGDGKGSKGNEKDVKSEEKKSKHKKDKKEKKKDKKDKDDSKKEEGEVKDKDNDKDKDRSRDKRKHRSRSRSKSRSRHGYSRRSRSPDRYYERSRYRSRSRSRERDRFSSSRGIWTRDLRARRRARSRSRDRDRRRRSRSYSPEEIDKKKLYEIAKANAYAQLQRGELPQNLLHKLPPLTQADKVAQKAGGRTVKELTEVCMQLASNRAGLDEDSDSDASPINKLIGSDDDPEEPFIRHPFKVKDAPLNIVMNIKNAVPLPVKDKDTLRLQFPVSSGTQHRKKEDEIPVNDPYGNWQIVKKDEMGPAPTQPKPVPPPKPVAVPIPDPILPILGTNITGPSEAAQALAGAVTTTTPATATKPAPVATTIPAIMPPPAAPPTVKPEDKVFEDPTGPTMDIGSIVSARLKAARALESNPHDVEALTQMHRSQTEIKNWTLAKQKPGMFTGSTGITLLSPQQLANSNPTKQAWAKKATSDYSRRVHAIEAALYLSHQPVIVRMAHGKLADRW